MEPATVVAGKPSRNHPGGTVIMVALLVVVPLLALLIVQQGRVIEGQRVLIRQLSIDSQQLNAMRMREQQNRAGKTAQPATPPSAEKQPSAPSQTKPAPEKKGRKAQQSRQAPSAPQEYPATRPVPVRKSV